MKDETITVVVDGQGLTTTSTPFEVASYLIGCLSDVQNYDGMSKVTVDKYTGDCAVTMGGNLYGKSVSIIFTVSTQ